MELDFKPYGIASGIKLLLDLGMQANSFLCEAKKILV